MPGLEDDIDEFLTPIIRILSASIKATIEAQLVRAYIQGDKELVFWGMTKGGFPIAYEGPPIDEAIKWAQKHCAQLVTKMDEETKARLAQVVSEAIENKKGIPGLAKNIRAEFDNMSTFRSQMIARTETCNALEQSFLDRASTMGIEGKEWVTFDPCEICAANGDEGVVPLDHVFSSGDDAPPAHPNCRCALAPARK
ncbi:MAG: phage head morphogenesis protein [Dehalococcoidia bacterium]|nr:phage head morphogenesis protein [Dehalococcoidia bacterium]